MRNHGMRRVAAVAAGGALTLFTALLCVSLGSVRIPLDETWRIIGGALLGRPGPEGPFTAILLSVRLPRVLCAGLMGAALSLCGAAMQGLLRNPLADGSTLGVSAGASLGAAGAILLGFSLPGFALGGTALLAMAFAFLSLLLILGLSYALDRSLSTQTILLTGVIFSMLVSSALSLLITFSGEKLRSITFWTMGSLSGMGYAQALLLLGVLAPFGGLLLFLGRELNAFALGEENARQVGVPVRRVKLLVMIAASALIGACVSVGGCIGFVGLIVPHMTRFVTGPDHRRLLPASLFAGGIFLMLTDLCARTLLRPLELPLGAVTSVMGAAVFLIIFYRERRKERGAC